MSNVLNLVSESTYVEKMDMQNALLKAIAAQSSGPALSVSSWAVVQQLVRLGIAAKVFSVGDQLVCRHKDYGTLTWDIIGIDHDKPADTAYTHSLTLQLHGVLPDCFLGFDAPETGSSDTNRQKYGSNNWSQSAVRQWLNSAAGAGSWWQAQTASDTAPGYAASADGFLKGLDAEFLSAVGSVSKTTAQNVITDGGGSIVSTERFFLLSETEVYGGLNSSVAEGTAYPYYADNSALNMAGSGTDPNRVKYSGETAQYWMLRSPQASFSAYILRVRSTGVIDSIGANSELGISPACCII